MSAWLWLQLNGGLAKWLAYATMAGSSLRLWLAGLWPGNGCISCAMFLASLAASLVAVSESVAVFHLWLWLFWRIFRLQWLPAWLN